ACGGYGGAAALLTRGRIEIVRGVEIRQDVRRILPAELRNLEAALLHRSPHLRPVVPHPRGEFREAHVVAASSEIGTDLAALAGHRMAGRAVTLGEQRLTLRRRAGHDLRGVPAGVTRGRGDIRDD